MIGAQNNMKNPSAETLAQAVELKKSGLPWHQVLNETGLSHSQAEIAYFKATLPKSMFHPFSVEKVVELRNEGVSWGVIGVRLNVPESQVRKAWKEATGTLSEGLRIGKGGAWLNKDPELYRDVLQPTGTTIPTTYGRTYAPVAAAQQRLIRLGNDDPKALRQLAQDQGINPKGKTNAQIIRALNQKLGNLVPGIDSPNTPKSAAKKAAAAPKAKKVSTKKAAAKEIAPPPIQELEAPKAEEPPADTEGNDEDAVILPFEIGELVDENA